MIKKTIIISILIGLLNYFIGLVIVNEYGMAARGFIEVINSVVSIVLSALSFNLYNSITKSVAINKSMPNLKSTLGIKIQLTQVTMAILITHYYLKSTNLDQTFNIELWALLTGLVVLIGNKINVNIAVLNGLKEIDKTKYVSLWGIAITTIVFIVCSKILKINLEIFVVFYFIAIYLTQYKASKWYFKKENIKISEDKFNIKILTVGSVLYIVSMVQLLASRAHIYVGVKYLGLENVGSYTVLSGLTQFVLMPATVMTTYLIAENKKNDYYSTIEKIQKIMIGTAALGTASIIFVYIIKEMNIKLGGLQNDGMIERYIELMPGVFSFALTSMIIATMSGRKITKLKLIIFTQALGMILMPLLVVTYSNKNNAMEISYTITQVLMTIIISTYWILKKDDNNNNTILE